MKVFFFDMVFMVGTWKLITPGTSTIFAYVLHMSTSNGLLHLLVDRVSVLSCGTSTLRSFLLPVPLEPGIRLQSLHVFLGSSISSLDEHTALDSSFSFFTSSRCEFINSSCTVNVHSTRRTASVVLYNCMITRIACRTSTTSLMNCIGVTSPVLFACSILSQSLLPATYIGSYVRQQSLRGLILSWPLTSHTITHEFSCWIVHFCCGITTGTVSARGPSRLASESGESWFA